MAVSPAFPPAADGVRSLQTHTDLDGLATLYWRLGDDAGCGNNRISVTAEGVEGNLFLCASADPGNASQINIGSGQAQVVEVGTLAPLPLEAWVNDGLNGVPNTEVTFTVDRR